LALAVSGIREAEESLRGARYLAGRLGRGDVDPAFASKVDKELDQLDRLAKRALLEDVPYQDVEAALSQIHTLGI
jgi:hypothetical protein